MKNKKIKKALAMYSLIGKALLACAGGIVGFVLGGPIAGIAGIFLGTLFGHFLGKEMLSVTS